MTFSGDLELFPFSELLQSLANLAHTGKLSLSRDEERAILLLRRGKILHAATSSIREALGSLLVGEKLLTQEELVEALEIQKGTDQEQRLGNILVESGRLGQDDLERVLTQKTQRVILELMQWTRGSFEFRQVEIEDRGEVGTDVSGLILAGGLDVESLLLTGAFELDHLASQEPPKNRPAAAANPVPDDDDGASSLRELMFEIRSPEFTGELNARIMEFASQLFNRSVLFSVKGDYFCGMGSFGVGLEQRSATQVRQLRIPVSEESILSTASELRTAYRGPLSDDRWNRRLAEYLGAGHPEEAVAVPLIADSRVVLVLYGDNAPENTPIKSIAALEAMAREVGRTMEDNAEADVAQPRPEKAAADSTPLSSTDLMSLVDTDPEPTVVVNKNAEIRYANQSMAAALSTTVSSLLGINACTLVHPDDGPDLIEFLHGFDGEGSASGKTARFPTADGSWQSFHLLPNTIDGQREDRVVMLRAATASESHRHHDPVTGLLDKEAAVQRIQRTLERSAREEDAVFAVMVLDLDRFKQINSSLGWAAGNEILCAVGERLSEHLRPSDAVSRLGGDRFCMILDRISTPSDARLAAQRILDLFARAVPAAGERVTVRGRIGIALDQGDRREAAEMIRDAERAARAAKSQHQSAIRLWETPPSGVRSQAL